jgi:phospholipid transport system transporter-binding protein
MSFRIEAEGQGLFRFVGDLTFDTAPNASEEALSLFAAVGGELLIDLQAVSHTDSAGIALLIEWVRQAKKKNKTLQFLNVPAQMLAIAQVSGLDQILPLSEKREGQGRNKG